LSLSIKQFNFLGYELYDLIALKKQYYYELVCKLYIFDAHTSLKSVNIALAMFVFFTSSIKK